MNDNRCKPFFMKVSSDPTRSVHIPGNGTYLCKIAPTPLVSIRLDAQEAPIWCKLDYLNPSGSTKDRIARYMVEKAWRMGKIGPGSWIVEASSGSTGIALALVCAQYNLRFLAVLPEGVSNERLLSIRAYGGEILTIPKSVGMAGAIARAEQEATARGGLATNQFANPDNSEAHRRTTAPEILQQICGNCVQAVVCGVGTGGTIVGLFQGCQDQGCPVRPFAAKPVSSGLISELECCSFSSRIPGVVDGISKLYVPENLPGLVELEVSDELALDVTRKLILRGFPVGPSSGLNYAAAQLVASRFGLSDIVTVFPDRMDRYFSTELFRTLQSPAS